ncbi:rhomboid family protein [Ceratobasidium sp. AG-Ba]|nr:rhomboid family protein [Ceratobasidium sp. AG-Ba]
MTIRRLATNSLGIFRACSHGLRTPSNTLPRRPLSFSPGRSFPRHDVHHREHIHWTNNGRPVQPSFTEELTMPSLLRPTLFALGVSGLAYYAAGTATNRDTQFWAEKLGAGQWWRGLTIPGSPELQRARLLDLKYRLTETLTSLRDNTAMLPGAVRQFINRSAYIAANNWLSAGEGRRTTIMITCKL